MAFWDSPWTQDDLERVVAALQSVAALADQFSGQIIEGLARPLEIAAATDAQLQERIGEQIIGRLNEVADVADTQSAMIQGALGMVAENADMTARRTLDDLQGGQDLRFTDPVTGEFDTLPGAIGDDRDIPIPPPRTFPGEELPPPSRPPSPPDIDVPPPDVEPRPEPEPPSDPRIPPPVAPEPPGQPSPIPEPEPPTVREPGEPVIRTPPRPGEPPVPSPQPPTQPPPGRQPPPTPPPTQPPPADPPIPPPGGPLPGPPQPPSPPPQPPGTLPPGDPQCPPEPPRRPRPPECSPDAVWTCGGNVTDSEGNPTGEPNWGWIEPDGSFCETQLKPPPGACPQCGCVVCQCGPRDESPPPPGFIVWEDAATGICYMTTRAEPPRHVDDNKLAEGDTASEAAAAASGLCPPTRIGQPQPGKPSDIQIVDTEGCDLDPDFLSGNGSGKAPTGSGVLDLLYKTSFGGRGAFIRRMDELRRISAGDEPGINALAEFRLGAWTWLEKVAGRIGRWLEDDSCFSAETLAAGGISILLDLLSFLSPTVGQQLGARSKYTIWHNCPQLYPSAAQAAQALIGGEIDESIAQVWTRMNNQCWTPQQRVIDAQKRRLEPLTASEMWLRGIIDDDKMREEFARMGWRDPRAVQWFRDLTVFIPPITDLVRFLVRDVDDDAIVRRFGLDAEFDAKWRGLTRESGRKQGISDEVALRYWRAHWTIPAPTQLYEMFHRSRPKPDGDPTKTTLDDVETAMRQQDILPFWIPRLIDATFRRLNRVDIRRAFNIGAMNEAQVRAEFQRSGYTEEGIDALVRFAKRQRFEAARSDKAVQLYRRRLLGEPELRNRLARRQLDLDEIDEIVRDSKRVAAAPLQNRCINAIRKRFLTGELDVADVQVQLANIAVPPEFVPVYIDDFRCELAAKGKVPSATQLCRWLELGVIDGAEMLDRLRRLGWSDDDSQAVLSDCLAKLNDRRRREAEKEAREQARAAERRQREAEKRRREAERRRKAADRLKKQQQRAEDRREELQMRSVAKLVELTGQPYDVVGGAVQGILQRLKRDFVLTADERTKIILLVVERNKPGDLITFLGNVLSAAEEAEELNFLPDDGDGVEGSGGGDGPSET